MEKNFSCPVCGAKCENLTALKNCIAEHEKAEKDSEAKKREVRINALKIDNEVILKKIRKNCEELRKLGVDAVVTYSTTMKTKEQEDIWKPFGEAIKIDKDELDSSLGSLESFLKAMLGGC